MKLHVVINLDSNSINHLLRQSIYWI